MRKTILLTAFLLFLLNLCAQQDTGKIRTIILEGIRLHDGGQYDAAVKKYDEALALDPAQLLAQYEKSYSLMASKKFKEAIAVSRQIIKNDRADSNMIGNAYSTWGTALDEDGNKKKALRVYEEGIKKVPGYNMLNYNKAVTYLRLNETKNGIDQLKQSIIKNPAHASSQYMLGKIMAQNNNRVAALMPFMVYLLLDNKSKRADEVLSRVRSTIEADIKKRDSNKYSVNLSLSALTGGPGAKAGREEDFKLAEQSLSLATATARSKTKDMLPGDRFAYLVNQFVEIIAARNGQPGFFSQFYVPFFAELKQRNYTDPFAHHIFMPSGNVMNEAWIQDHQPRIEAFHLWAEAYKWPDTREIALR